MYESGGIMIPFHPLPYARHDCPSCRRPLQVRGWYMPGMRPLADLFCAGCGREYYGDLAAAQALYTPMLVERSEGKVYDRYGVAWFAKWLESAYASRSNDPVPLVVEEFRTVRRPVLLNCLDRVYGHALLKLLNAQHYLDRHADMDLIVLVPRYLRWMVPDGVAAIWTADIPLRAGACWNDWLAGELARLVGRYQECMLSIALPHPHPDDFDIERFTRVPVFPEERWRDALRAPLVTFIWREDRLWLGPGNSVRNIAWKLRRKAGISSSRLPEQRRRMLELAGIIRKSLPGCRFAVAGLGEPGELPGWMEEHRIARPDTDQEREWCRLYSRSHLVIGVHGSNLLLPSAHAGAVINLMPADRWPNMLQDMLIVRSDPREAMLQYRLLPVAMPLEEIGEIAVALLASRNALMLHMGREYSLHERARPGLFAERRLEMKELMDGKE